MALMKKQAKLLIPEPTETQHRITRRKKSCEEKSTSVNPAQQTDSRAEVDLTWPQLENKASRTLLDFWGAGIENQSKNVFAPGRTEYN